jgi:hypothetical protein
VSVAAEITALLASWTLPRIEACDVWAMADPAKTVMATSARVKLRMERVSVVLLLLSLSGFAYSFFGSPK